MSKIALEGNASGTGTFTVAAPNSSSNFTITLPAATGTVQVSGNAISGTTGDFSSTIKGGSTISVGGATPAASGAGITFPASASASSDANTLDDYEEGTWTPTVTKGTVSNSNCGYRKIGSQVTVWGNMFSFSDRTSADAVLMGGLPFTVNASFDDVGSGSAMWQYSNLDGGTVYIDSASQLQFYAGTTSGGFTVLKHNSLNNASASVYLVATYIASS
jgi:hypothetical protein